jgi:hypothetical protein
MGSLSGVCPVSLLSDLDAGCPLVESPSESPGGWSAPDYVDLATEVAAPAALLAEVVELAGDCAVFPSRLQVVAELALEHDSVRRALAAEGTAS